ncbi:MAG TPA: threonine--tRNA ligase [Candidatus Azoamicus sp. OHIO1]
MINVIINEEKKIKLTNNLKIRDLLILLGDDFTKKIICAYINDKIVDVNYEITCDMNIKLIDHDDSISRDIIRHSCSHLLAHAVKMLYPNTKISIGPTIKDGFYYDFLFYNKVGIDIIDTIELKMHELMNKNLILERLLLTKKDACDIFKNEKYKLKIIDTIDDNLISCYKQGDFIDLCLGPHVPSTGFIKYFKLQKMSGAYWQGDSKNEMLQRIYGTAWETEKNLKNHLNFIEEAKSRDHKKIGKNLNLYDFHKDSPGTVFWYPKGWIIYQEIIKYIRKILNDNGYNEVNTPTILNSGLFEKSGHMEKFSENIFKYKNLNSISILKPMSCPCHIQIFNGTSKSYKDLPYRISEFGSCYRNELSGALYGLMRLKNFIQDDGHIFCTEYQIHGEILSFIELLKIVYVHFNFKKFNIKLSKKPNNFIGDDNLWEKAENSLQKAIEDLNIDYTVTNDGAFYGPKIEVLLTDSLNRQWQCGTIQVDFFTGKNLNAKYTESNGSILNPIILHRAILGSIERFIGILIEDTKGILPFWLTPIQIIIVNINNKNDNFIKTVYNTLKLKYRVQLDLRQERIEFKIRDHVLQKIPYVLIIGDKESKNNTVTIRELNGNNIENISINSFMNKIDLITQ